MGTDDLYGLACEAEDSGQEVYVYRHEYDDDVIWYVEIDGETFHNENMKQELDQSSDAERWWRE